MERPFPKSLAVVVGIDDYRHGVPRLRNAGNDARRLARILAEDHGYKVLTLIRGVGRQRILHLLAELRAEAGPEDRVLFYFAGHGVAYDDKKGLSGFLVPEDARPDRRGTLFSMDLLKRELDEVPHHHLLVILDCCFAGSFRWSMTRDSDFFYDEVHLELYRRFVQDPAWQVITSSAHDQKARDLLWRPEARAGDNGHSPFAQALFQGLQGKADLVPEGGDGLITVHELHTYLREEVERRTVQEGSPQTPGLWSLLDSDKGEFVFEVPDREMDLPPAPELDEEANPYRGLEPFEAKHEELFFGRAEVLKTLCATVRKRPLTIVTGPSGTGKSSLVRAGLVPALTRQPIWRVIGPMRPTADPFAALRQALEAADLGTSSDADGYRVLRDQLRDWLNVHPDLQLVLVVDQFEELVTLVPHARQQAFPRFLTDALAEDLDRLRLVVTVRSDFEPHFIDGPLKDFWQHNRMVIPQMTHDELRQAVLGPAARRVVLFEDGLVEDLVEEVLQMPGALPLLSFALRQLYLAYVASQRTDRTLTRRDYQKLGGVIGSLRNRAELEYRRLGKEQGPEVQATLRQILLRMVTPGRKNSRRRVPRRELEFPSRGENARVAQVLARLSNARLIVDGIEPNGEAYVEPAHDKLISAWDRLQRWLQAEDTDLPLQRWITLASNHWDSDKRPDNLLTPNDPRIPQLRDLVSVETSWLNACETDFVQASHAARVAERARRRRRRRLIGGSIAAIAIIAVFAAWRFNVQRLEAIRANFLSIAQSLAIQAEVAREGDDDELARLLAVQAYRFHHEHGGGQIAPIDAALRDSLGDGISGFPLREATGDGISALSFHQQRLAAGIGAQIYLWDLASVQPMPKVLGEIDIFEISHLAFTADGRQLISHSMDPGGRDSPRLALWDLGDSPTRRFLEDPAPGLWSIAVRPTPPLLVVALRLYGESAALQPITLDPSGEPLHGPEIPVADAQLATLAWSPDGRKLVGATFIGELYEWDFSDPDQPSEAILLFARDDLSFDSLLWGGDGRILAGSFDGKLLIWDAATGEASVRDSADGSVSALAFDARRGLLATGRGPTIRVSRPGSEGASETTLAGHDRTVVSLAWSADGQHLASGDSEGVLRLWQIQEAADRQVLTTGSNVLGVDFQPVDGSRLAAATVGGGLSVWPVKDGAVDAPSRVHSPAQEAEIWFHQAVFLPDGQTLLAGAPTSDILTAFDPASLEATDFFTLSSRLLDLGVSADGRVAAASYGTGPIRFLRLDQESWTPTELRDHEGNTSSLAFHPNDFVIAIAGEDSAHLWRLDLEHPEASIRFTPLELYSMQTPASSVAWGGPEGHTLAAGSGDESSGEIWVWDMDRPGEIPRILRGPEGFIATVDFSPDGRRLAAAGKDQTVYIWDLHYPEAPPVELKGHQGEITSLSWHPTAPLLASGSYGTSVHVWTTEAGALAEAVCRRVRRNLTWEEWSLAVGPDIPYASTCPRPAVVHPSVYAAAKQIARDGDVRRGTSIVRRALELDQRADLDPRHESMRAFLRTRGVRSARDGHLRAALRDLRMVDKHWGGTPAEDWDQVCWQGCRHGKSRRVLAACERAVRLAPDSDHRATRGLALGLAGDRDAALRDLRWIMEHRSESTRAYYCQTWIERLEADQELLSANDLRTTRFEW